MIALRKRRKRHDLRSLRSLDLGPVGPRPLVLVAGEYEPAQWVELTFDRAIDIDALDGSQILVDDGQYTGIMFEATQGAVLVGPAKVRINLMDMLAATGIDVRLTATAFSGIVAADDGGTWEGVSGVELPLG